MNGILQLRCGRFGLLLGVLLGSGAPLWAQAPLDPPATRQGMDIRGQGAAGQPVLPSVSFEKKPFYVQGIVVATLFGGALWAVCHSSRRL